MRPSLALQYYGEEISLAAYLRRLWTQRTGDVLQANPSEAFSSCCIRFDRPQVQSMSI